MFKVFRVFWLARHLGCFRAFRVFSVFLGLLPFRV